MKSRLPLLILLLSSSAQAEIFKCVQDGRTTFSQQPCATNAQLVELEVYQPPAQAAKEQAVIHAGMQANSRRIERDYGLLVLQRRIADSATAIAEMMREREARLADLRAQKNDAKKSEDKKLISLEITRTKGVFATEIALEKDRKQQCEREYSALKRTK